ILGPSEFLGPRYFSTKSSTRETGGPVGRHFSRAGEWFDARDRRSAAHLAYFSTTPEMPEGRATSRGSTFPPPAICGCDGSKPLAQFSFQHQRTRHKEGVFQIIGAAQRSIEKGVAEIGPLGFVLASERRVVSICCGDDKRI